MAIQPCCDTAIAGQIVTGVQGAMSQQTLNRRPTRSSKGDPGNDDQIISTSMRSVRLAEPSTAPRPAVSRAATLGTRWNVDCSKTSL